MVIYLLSLDVSQNPNVTEIYCYNNQLMNLDVAKGIYALQVQTEKVIINLSST